MEDDIAIIKAKTSALKAVCLRPGSVPEASSLPSLLLIYARRTPYDARRSYILDGPGWEKDPSVKMYAGSSESGKISKSKIRSSSNAF